MSDGREKFIHRAVGSLEIKSIHGGESGSARHQIERGQVSAWQGGRNQGSQVTEMDAVACDSVQGVGCARSAATQGPGAEKARVTCSADDHGCPFCSTPVKTVIITRPYPAFRGPTMSQ